MFKLDSLNPKIYLSGAIVMGFFGIIDGLFALLGYTSAIASAFSLLEVCWVVTSMVFFLTFKKQNLSKLVPGMYMLYTLYGWMVGSYLLSNKVSGQALTLPVWYMISATIFGLLYCIISARTYTRWYVKN